jgi:hypothetical protein
MKPYLLAATSLVLLACEAGAPAPGPTATAEKPAATTAPAATQHPAAAIPGRSFGEPIKLTEETPLDAISTEPAKFSGKTVRTTGVVQAVCQSAGCWMEIGDDAKRAHIKMAGHAFFVPKDCTGKRAVVEGTVQGGPPADTCGSKDKCGGEDNGAIAKTEIIATGVQLID